MVQFEPEGCGKLLMPASVTAELAGGFGTVKPPTLMYVGAPPAAPFQFGADGVPVPGQAWQELQSVVPEVLVKLAWLGLIPAPGFTFMWQLLHRPVVLFIRSGLEAVKLWWNRACAHSFP